MVQESIVDKIVKENRKDPRNKITISCSDMIDFSSEERDVRIDNAALLNAVEAYSAGTADGPAQEIADAATALCHQVADRVWGKCLDQKEDKWEEIGISVDWIKDTGGSAGVEIAAVVRRM